MVSDTTVLKKKDKNDPTTLFEEDLKLWLYTRNNNGSTHFVEKYYHGQLLYGLAMHLFFLLFQVVNIINNHNTRNNKQ